MRYEAASLDEIYSILADMQGALAVMDFMCGELGYEALASQSLGLRLYKEWKKKALVVALCWKGCCLLYDNVSDDQIEFTNTEDSMRGNWEHDAGKGRLAWLKEMGHGARIDSMPNVVRHSPPMSVRAKRLWHDYGISQTGLHTIPTQWYAKTQFIFQPPSERLIKEDYIALFCRNDPAGDYRTEPWQIELFHQWAKQFGLRLAVVADLWPRELPPDVIHVKPLHRDLDLICNVVHHSLLYGAPACGAAEVATIFGCNFVLFSRYPIKPNTKLVGGLAESRGFRYFGVLEEPSGEVAKNIAEYLGKQRV